MTATTRPDAAPQPAPDLPDPRATTACPACHYQARSVERHLFFAFVEGLSDSGFLGRLEQGGGYCVEHSRAIMHRFDASQLTDAYRRVLSGRLAQLREPASKVAWLEQCPACKTAAWASEHVIWLLLTGISTNDPDISLDPDRPFCLPHLRRAFERSDWRSWPLLRRHLVRTLSVGAAEPAVLIGGDPQHGWRTTRPAATTQSAWAGGLISYDGLLAELEHEGCPVCTAVTAASGRFLEWLASAAARTDSGMALRLCADHAWDATWGAPEAAARAIRAAATTWEARLERLPADADLPPTDLRRRLTALPAALRQATLKERERAKSARRRFAWQRELDRAISHLAPHGWTSELLTRLLRAEECAACRASATTLVRCAALVRVTLTDSAGRERYARSGGVCLRHLASVLPGASPAATAPLLERAAVRTGLVTWQLEEASRKMSWSVRHEGRGAEGTAWQRAMALNVGSAIFDDRWLTADPGGRPRPAI